jgi:hypothetical protein
MAHFLIVYRGAPSGAFDNDSRDARQWDAWFAGLGSALLERGSLTHSSVEIPTRLLGPKLSSSSLAGYSLVEAEDFNAAVQLAETCPIFDEHGSVEIARLEP